MQSVITIIIFDLKVCLSLDELLYHCNVALV